MSDLDSYAFEPGQQVQCKTRFDDVLKGEVVAFDLSSKVLILKSPSSSGVATNNDLHFVVLDSVSDVQILQEPRGDAVNDQLPDIDPKYIKARTSAAAAERIRLIEAVENGVSREGISLFTALSKKFERLDVTWKEDKIVVMKDVIINPPYEESDCQPLSQKSPKEAVSYVRTNVRKFWDSNAKEKSSPT